jgi:hypothetical protein
VEETANIVVRDCRGCSRLERSRGWPLLVERGKSVLPFQAVLLNIYKENGGLPALTVDD